MLSDDEAPAVTPTATADAANAHCMRTGSSPMRAGGTSRPPEIDEDRIFRLDRIADARTLPGSFEAPVPGRDRHPAPRTHART
jgi:hypothetical protein